MKAGELSPDAIRALMVNAISSYVVAFIRREGLSAKEATRLLGINMEQLSAILQEETSLELEQMLDILTEIGANTLVLGRWCEEGDQDAGGRSKPRLYS